MYKIALLLLTLLCSISFVDAGIYRHDRDEKLYIALAHQKQFDCVGQVFYSNGSIGSCTLIDSNYVLSAAHVFYFKKDSTWNFKIKYNGKYYGVKRLIIHKQYNPDVYYKCDVALIELTHRVPDVIPAVISKSVNNLHAHIVGVGYGNICMATKPATNSKSTIGNKMGSSQPENLEYIVNGGDSGGGMFKKENGQWVFIGVCTGGGLDMHQFFKTFYYGQIMEWTRVSAFQDWIAQNEK